MYDSAQWRIRNMKVLYTKSEVARLLGVDIRSNAIKALTPVCQAKMASKIVDLYEDPQK